MPKPWLCRSIPITIHQAEGGQGSSNDRFGDIVWGTRGWVPRWQSVIVENDERVESWLIRRESKGVYMSTDGIEKFRGKF